MKKKTTIASVASDSTRPEYVGQRGQRLRFNATSELLLIVYTLLNSCVSIGNKERPTDIYCYINYPGRCLPDAQWDPLMHS